MKPITSNGRVITDAEVQAMADEAEAGYTSPSSNADPRLRPRTILAL